MNPDMKQGCGPQLLLFIYCYSAEMDIEQIWNRFG